MSRAARLLWGCAGLAALVFLALFGVSKGMLEPAGMVIFDSRVWGYEPDEARRYLDGLDNMLMGRSTYLGTFRALDTVFPLLLTICLSGAIWLNTFCWNKVVRGAAALVPAAYLWADLSENAIVAQMVRAGSTVSDEVVRHASGLTQLKWAMLACGAMVLLVTWRFACARTEGQTR